LLTRIVAESHVAGLGAGNERAVGIENVFLGGRGMLSIVKENRNVFLLEAVNIFNVFHHVHSIIVASRELSLFANVVDSNDDGSVGSRAAVGDNLKLGLDVEGTRGGELGNLRVSSFLEIAAHREQNFLKAQVLVRDLVIGIQYLEHGGSTRSSALPIRVGQLKRRAIVTMVK
jgi:hypothetical protein